MSENVPQSVRPGIKWTDIKVFTAEGTDLAVRVQCSDGNRPMFSYAIGRVRNERFTQYIHPQTSVQNGVVNLTPLPIETLSRLIAQAEVLIHSKIQEREDAWLLKRQEREMRQVNFGKQDVNRTGKTARKKGKHEEQERDDGWK